MLLWILIIIDGIMEIENKPEKSIFTYALNSNSVLLTGWAFSIKSSLPVTTGYIITVIFAYILWRRV
jgi:hypothetical protein